MFKVNRLSGEGYTFSTESSIMDPQGGEVCVVNDQDDNVTAKYIADALSARAGDQDAAVRVLAEVAKGCKANLVAMREGDSIPQPTGTPS